MDNKRHSLVQKKLPSEWKKEISKNGAGIEEEVILTSEEWIEEIVLTGLRCSNGVDLGWIKAIDKDQKVKENLSINVF